MTSIQSFAQSILTSGNIDEKIGLTPLDLAAFTDAETSEAIFLTGPNRSPPWLMSASTERLPNLHQVVSSLDARCDCLLRFAHHEIQAVELFAWALLAFPGAPALLRRGLLAALVEEQTHARLYLSRIESLRSMESTAVRAEFLMGKTHSDYLWRHIPSSKPNTDGMLRFLASMGLTFEQANLDFTLRYRQAFLRAGDHESAAVLQRVHDDEIGHVRLAALWFRKLSSLSPVSDVPMAETNDDESFINAYVAHVPFPLSAVRAKGKGFQRKSRERAGLSPAYIDFVDAARPTHQASTS